MASRQGYTNWNRAKEAGIVSDYIAWDDRDVIRDHAIGYTKDTMGSCFPIDLAVAYSLVSSGPNNPLTLKELVNENTKMATVMMSGKVGYGTFVHPDMSLCNHDMKKTRKFYFPKVTLSSINNNDFCLHIDGSSSGNNITQSDAFSLMPPHIQEKCTLYSDGIIGGNPELYEYIQMGVFNDVRLWLESHYSTTEWSRSGSRLPKSTNDLGVCGFDDIEGVAQPCKHHNSSQVNTWFMLRHPTDENKFVSLWRRGKGCTVNAYWNDDHLTRYSETGAGREELSLPIATRIVPFDKISRAAANGVDEKIVIKEIRAALTRMKSWSGNRSLVTDDTEYIRDEDGELTYKYDEYGNRTSSNALRTRRSNNTKYSWRSWGWVIDMNVFVADTHSKNRKEGETQCSTCYQSNVLDAQGDSYCECDGGWKYIKYSSKQSYGHEIAKFRWEPITSPHAYAYKSWPSLDIIAPELSHLVTIRKLLVSAGTRVPLSKSTSKWSTENNSRESITEEVLKSGGLKACKFRLRTVSDIQIESTLEVDGKLYQPEVELTPKDILYTYLFKSGDDIHNMCSRYKFTNTSLRFTNGVNYQQVSFPKPTPVEVTITGEVQ